MQAYKHLAFKLELPSNWKIHLVMLIAMLKLASNEQDSYFRAIKNDLSLVKNQKDNNRYEIERLLNRRVISRGRNAR